MSNKSTVPSGFVPATRADLMLVDLRGRPIAFPNPYVQRPMMRVRVFRGWRVRLGWRIFSKAWGVLEGFGLKHRLLELHAYDEYDGESGGVVEDYVTLDMDFAFKWVDVPNPDYDPTIVVPEFITIPRAKRENTID
jgi:hypothetical protein